MVKVALIGMGCGTAEGLTQQGWRALKQAEYIIGSEWLLEGLPEGCTRNRAAAVRGEEILSLLLASGCRYACVLYSGDTGFYSGARTLLPLLSAQGIGAEMLPGVSSVQYFAAKLGHPWQSWSLCSANGKRCDAVEAVCAAAGKLTFFLTDGAEGPARLCRQLAEAGLGQLQVIVGENLGCEGEKVYMGTAAECAKRTFAQRNVLLAAAPRRPTRRVPGIPDSEFVRREGVPMLGQEVRAAALAKLAVGGEDLCWDIGAGTGSVGVELALQCRSVWAVEREEAALALARANREKFGAWNLSLVEGEAPQALEQLPRPDAVFVGAGAGGLPEILQAVHHSGPQARVCVAAVSLEALYTAHSELARLDREVEVTQLSVSRTWPAEQPNLLQAQDPVFLITGTARQGE